jgi:Phage integrase, N-terminal SAM-like domain
MKNASLGHRASMDRAALSLLLRSFERHLRAENRSEHTIASYLDSLCQAEAFLAGRGRTLVDARREDLEAFLGELLQRRAPETVATRYRRLRVLYRWLRKIDPTSLYDQAACRVVDTRTWTVRQVDRHSSSAMLAAGRLLAFGTAFGTGPDGANQSYGLTLYGPG